MARADAPCGYHQAVSASDVAERLPSLTPEARAFLAATRFAVVGTVNPDGGPHSAVVWYRLDDDEVVINSAVGRRWPANLVRDPRVDLTVADGYRFVQLRGRVSIVDDQPTAQADIAEMARRYHADEPEDAEALIRNRFTRQRRISFRLRPSRISVDL